MTPAQARNAAIIATGDEMVAVLGHDLTPGQRAAFGNLMRLLWDQARDAGVLSAGRAVAEAGDCEISASSVLASVAALRLDGEGAGEDPWLLESSNAAIALSEVISMARVLFGWKPGVPPLDGAGYTLTPAAEPDVTVTGHCEPACWTPATCPVCGNELPPRGRAVPLEMNLPDCCDQARADARLNQRHLWSAGEGLTVPDAETVPW